MTNHIDRLPEIAKAETVIGTYPDLGSSDGRGLVIIKEPSSFSKIASGKAAILWIECEAWTDAQAAGHHGDVIDGARRTECELRDAIEGALAPMTDRCLAEARHQLAHWVGRGRFRGEDDLPGTPGQVTTDHAVILLAHEPDIFVKVLSRVCLTWAGHTHGGQIRIPLLWPSFVPSRSGARFAYGHIVETGRHMIVSGGLGTNSVPVWLGMPDQR
jgi:hypothetical protein